MARVNRSHTLPRASGHVTATGLNHSFHSTPGVKRIPEAAKRDIQESQRSDRVEFESQPGPALKKQEHVFFDFADLHVRVGYVGDAKLVEPARCRST